jgi:hypothetical protein
MQWVKNRKIIWGRDWKNEPFSRERGIVFGSFRMKHHGENDRISEPNLGLNNASQHFHNLAALFILHEPISEKL